MCRNPTNSVAKCNYIYVLQVILMPCTEKLIWPHEAVKKPFMEQAWVTKIECTLTLQSASHPSVNSAK